MTTANSSDWIRRYHSASDGAVRLVCLPFAGGSASGYYAMSAALAPLVEPLVVQLPGRQDRRGEPCIDNIPELVDQIFAALEPWTDRPLVLFGHSMGAVLGFEVARRMEQFGRSPLRLFASGGRAPSRVRDERVHTMSDDDIIAELARLDGTESQLLSDEELLRLIIPVVRNDYRAIETYRCAVDATVACPITVFTGDSDPRVTAEDADAWRDHTSSEFTSMTFPGGHFFINDSPDKIADAIVCALAESSMKPGRTPHSRH